MKPYTASDDVCTSVTRHRRSYTGKRPTLILSVYAQQIENDAIVHRKSPNEYFRYLFGPRDCFRTKLLTHHQNPLQSMYATGLRRPCFTRSFMSSRLNWPASEGACWNEIPARNLMNTNASQ